MSAVTAMPPPGKAPPGPRGLPVFGSLLGLRRQPHLAIARYARRYGDVCLLRFGSVPTVIISHPALVKEAFDQTELANRWVSEIMDTLSDQKDLALSPYNEHWRQMQRFANRELLGGRNLQRIRQQFVEEISAGLLEEVGDAADAGASINPPALFSSALSNLMFRSVFGRGEGDTGEFDRRRQQLIEHINWIFVNASAVNLADYIPWLRALPSNAVKDAQAQAAIGSSIVRDLIEATRQRPGLDLDNPGCLVEVMLASEAAGEISDEMSRHLCADLLIAGIDTTGATLTWLLLLLANRPAVQAQIQQELDAVIGPDALPNFDDRERLPWLSAAIMESMRYRTIGPFALPHRASVDTAVGGYHIPAGAQVLGNIYSIHHDPRFWERPDEFDAGRFLPTAESPHPAGVMSGAYMPFSTGHRRCPGRRLAEIIIWTVAGQLLHRYRFAPPAGRPLSEEEVWGLSLAPHPFRLQAARR